MARAGYWQGRAHEALGDAAAATAAYAKVARYQTSYYGLLAAESVGLPLDPALAGREALPDWNGAAFTRHRCFRRRLLRAAGAGTLAKRFFLHLGEGLSDDDLARLAGLALRAGTSRIWRWSMAKAAADQGRDLARAYLPADGHGGARPAGPPELALAITRRESEFDPAVISLGRGARADAGDAGDGRDDGGKGRASVSLDRLLSDWRIQLAAWLGLSGRAGRRNSGRRWRWWRRATMPGRGGRGSWIGAAAAIRARTRSM